MHGHAAWSACEPPRLTTPGLGRKPSKLTPVPRAADLDGVSPKLASVSEGIPESRARPSQPAINRRWPLEPRRPVQAAPGPNKAKPGRMGRRQRLKKLETKLLQNCTLKANPSTTLWRRPMRSVFAGR